jgi:hypothetical protein
MTALDESQPILSLRCRDAQWRDSPEVLDAFARPAVLPKARRELAVAELLVADHHARAWLGLAPAPGVAPRIPTRPVLTCETARFGAAAALERSDVDLAEWTRFDELGGDLLLGLEPHRLARARPTAIGMRVRRSLAAIAAAVPMLTLSIAEASPPDARLIAAAPPPKLPDDANAGPKKPTADPVPMPSEPVPAPTTEAPPMPEPPVVVPPPVVRDDSLSLTGRNLWEGLVDKPIILVMKDGSELLGSIVAQSGKDLAFARSSDGAVVAVPKTEVSGIRVRRIAESSGASPRPRGGGTTETGHKLAAGGGAMLGIGSTAALAGTVMLGIYISALYISLPLLLPGLAMIGGGASLLSAANKKRAAYDKAWGITSGRRRVLPTASASRQGGQVGLVLRF